MRTRRRTLSRLHKAPRRRSAACGWRGRGFEALETRAMLSADGQWAGVPADVLDRVESSPPIPGNLLANQISAGVGSALIEPLVPLEETFTLNSYPTANHTIYLDFDGHDFSDTDWRFFASGPDELVAPDYDIDDTPGVFSDAELMNIQEAWARVAEDFAPFNINVTTEEPPIGDLTRPSPADLRWGVRIVIGGSTFDWFGQESGGVALLNSFTDAVDTPAFAFEESGFEVAKNLAEVISHEAGHTLGLSHDGQLPEEGWTEDTDPEDPEAPEGPVEYYPGHGDWGTIMGVSYDPEITQWSEGEYHRANNQEDDLAIIASQQNGFGFRDDDHVAFVLADPAGSFELATALERDRTVDGDPFFGAGVIENRDDFDLFEFRSAVGEVTITADPAMYGPNLNIALTAYDELGNVMGESTQDENLGATLTFMSPVSGNYYVEVTGVGFGDPVANPEEPEGPPGYSDYGSLGQYGLEILSPFLPPPDPWEENDLPAAPLIASSADYFFNNATIDEGGDNDYYRWTAGEDGVLSVELTFREEFGDLDLRLLDQFGNRLASSAGIDGDELIANYPVEQGRSYIVYVFSPTSDPHFEYDLLIDGPGHRVDAFDVFDGTVFTNALGGENDSVATASVLDPTDYDLDLSIHVPEDEDYFQWTSPGNGTLELDALFDHDEANIDIRVLDAAGEEIGIAESSDDNEFLGVPVVRGETYTIHVYASFSTMPPGDAAYRLIIDGPDIDEDEFEPNSAFANATDLTDATGRYDRLSIHNAEDKDFFLFQPTQTGDILARALFVHDRGDLDMRLLRVIPSPGGDDSAAVVNGAPTQIISESTSVTDNESIVERVVKGQTYLIEVYGFEGATQVIYTFDLQFAAAIPVPGDYDGNGFVDLGDREVWKSFYGASEGALPEGETELLADGNGDGVVNSADHVVWRNNLGEGREPQFSAASATLVKADAPAAFNALTLQPTVLRAVADPTEPEPATTAVDQPELGAVYVGVNPIDETPSRSRAAAPRATSLFASPRDEALLLVSTDAPTDDEGDLGFTTTGGDEEPLDDAFAALGVGLGETL